MEFLTALLVALIPVLLGSGGLVMYFLTKRDSKNAKLDRILHIVEDHTEKIENIDHTVNLLAEEACETLHDMLERYYIKFESQGYITPEQKAVWNQAYSTAKSLHINGESKVWNEQIEQLEVKAKKKRKSHEQLH